MILAWHRVRPLYLVIMQDRPGLPPFNLQPKDTRIAHVPLRAKGVKGARRARPDHDDMRSCDNACGREARNAGAPPMLPPRIHHGSTIQQRANYAFKDPDPWPAIAIAVLTTRNASDRHWPGRY